MLFPFYLCVNYVISVVVYLVPLMLIFAFYVGLAKRRDRSVAQRELKAEEDKVKQPNSIHPYIDLGKCLGCGACTQVCPEGDVLGLANGRARLVEGANCIGHGACAAACPFDAITLVFGTAERGVELPKTSPEFQSTRDGVFISGELGGMGLIRNAIIQGTEAVEAIAAKLTAAPSQSPIADIVIVGAGPSGIAAALQAKKLGLSFVLIEQAEKFGGTVANFPRNKLVMTSPAELPLYGKLKFREVSKEALIELFTGVVKSQEIAIEFGQKMLDIEGEFNNFTVVTEANRFQSKAVLLCLGRRGSPRKLGVPGEESTKVTYSLIDASEYVGQHVLVVGGGDSALEAAHSIAEEADTHVTLSYRGDGFSRAKPANRERIDSAEQSGKLHVLLGSNITAIESDSVTIVLEDESVVKIKNDSVIVCAGGELPTPVLKRNAIEVVVKHGEP